MEMLNQRKQHIPSHVVRKAEDIQGMLFQEQVYPACEHNLSNGSPSLSNLQELEETIIL